MNNCTRCGLPFTLDYPEYNPSSHYHEAAICIMGLRAELAKPPRIDLAAPYGYECGLDVSLSERKKLRAALAKYANIENWFYYEDELPSGNIDKGVEWLGDEERLQPWVIARETLKEDA